MNGETTWHQSEVPIVNAWKWTRPPAKQSHSKQVANQVVTYTVFITHCIPPANRLPPLSALTIESKWLRLPNVRSAAKRMFPFPIVPAARRHFTAPKTARPNTGLLTSKTANDPTTSSSSTSTRKRSLIHQSGGHSPCHQTALLGSFIALSKLLSIGRPPTAMSSTSTIHPSIRMLKRHKIAWQKSNA